MSTNTTPTRAFSDKRAILSGGITGRYGEKKTKIFYEIFPKISNTSSCIFKKLFIYFQ